MKIIVLTAMHERHEMTEIFAMAMSRLRKYFDIETCAAVTIGDVENARICREHNFSTVMTKNNPVSNKFNSGMQLLRDKDWTHVMILGSDDIPSNRFVELQMRHPGADFIGVRDMWFWGLNPKRAGFDTFTYWDAGSSRIGAGRVISRRIVEACDYKLWPDGKNGGLDSGSVANIRSKVSEYEAVSYAQEPLGGFLVDVKYELHISSLSPVISRGVAEDHDIIWDHLPGNECRALLRLREKVKAKSNL